VASIALGAKFTLVGRAYLYGLMAGGRAGVDRAIQILGDQVVRTMKLLEVNSVEELTPAHVTQLERLAPRARAEAATRGAQRPTAPAKRTTAAAKRPTSAEKASTVAPNRTPKAPKLP
jgi:L-lactate dehydrogenase (cytochrome)